MNKCIVCSLEFEGRLIDSLGRKAKPRKYCSQYCSGKAWRDKHPEKVNAHSLEAQLKQVGLKKEDIRFMICVICKNKVYAKDVINFNSRKTCGRTNCEIEYKRQHNIEYQRKIKGVSTFPKTRCRWCNRYFYPTSENQLLCSEYCNTAKKKVIEYDQLCEELKEQIKKHRIYETTHQCILCRKEFKAKTKRRYFCFDCEKEKTTSIKEKYIIKFKDGLRCQICNILLPIPVFDVHHKVSRKERKDNSHSNLITICPICHALIHRCSYTIEELTRIYSL